MFIPDYFNIDLHEANVDLKTDIRKLPFPDGCADEILTSHVIEHFHFFEAFGILKEWKRVLKIGGVLVVECPDLFAICSQFVSANDARKIEMYSGLFGQPWYPGGGHEFVYTPVQLRWTLEQCGFKNIKQEDPLLQKYLGIKYMCMRFICQK